jgi:hypothetical protein
LRSYIVSIAASLLVPLHLAAAAQLPPDSLIRENCRKAEAVIEGRIVASETQPNQFTQTRFRVSRVYQGPMHAGEELTYYSWREIGRRSAGELSQTLIVFLVSRTDAGGVKRWGTATDFSEFPGSPALESKVSTCTRRKMP